MSFALLVAGCIYRWVGFGIATPEYLRPAYDLANTHRIDSVFLPVGYSGFLGLGLIVTYEHGLVLANLAIYLLLVVATWMFLRASDVPAKVAAIMAAIVIAMPNLCVSIYKVLDSNITALFLLAVLAGILFSLKRFRWRVDLGLAVCLGLAMLTRSNLLLLCPLCWIAWWKFGAPKLPVDQLFELLGVKARGAGRRRGELALGKVGVELDR